MGFCGAMRKREKGKPMAPSKVMPDDRVPTTALTVTAEVRAAASPARISQSSEVAEAHASVAQSVEATALDGVASSSPKLRPATVAVPPPLPATLLGSANDTVGAGTGEGQCKNRGSRKLCGRRAGRKDQKRHRRT